jgi:prepilin-type N-terminal cleavage/methylation domain-containing protein
MKVVRFFTKKGWLDHKMPVNYPAHRARHFKKLKEGDCIPLTPTPYSSPSTGRGILQENFIKRRDFLDNQKGFTLIEIIAVLLILGIIAAIAVPKYFDVQETAKDKALDGAIAEGSGRMNAYFGSRVLDGDSRGQIIYSDANIGTAAGDFGVSYSGTGTAAGQASGAAITITATGNATANTNSKSRTVGRP